MVSDEGDWAEAGAARTNSGFDDDVGRTVAPHRIDSDRKLRLKARLLHFWSAAGEADVRLRLNLYHLKSVAVLVPTTSRTDPVGLFR